MAYMPDNLSDEQIKELREVFNQFDKEGDNTISIHELGTCMRTLGQIPTEEELARIIAEIDADGNGIVEFPEFADLMSRRSWGEQGSEKELREAFAFFDTSKDGYIEAAELRRLLTSVGESLTDEELDEMMNSVNVDGDGNVKYDECVAMIMELS